MHGLGAALFEELAYDERGNFLSGTFADYLCPTAVEVPPLEIGHVETASPVNALGAKGMGDGSSMLTPAAIANAVADALGRDDIALPLTLQRVWSLANGRRPDLERGRPTQQDQTERRRRRGSAHRRRRGHSFARRSTRCGGGFIDAERARGDRAGMPQAHAGRAGPLFGRGGDRRCRHSRQL